MRFIFYFLLALLPVSLCAQEFQKFRFGFTHGAGPLVLKGNDIKGPKTVLGGQVMLKGMVHMKYVNFGLGFDNLLASGDNTTLERPHPADSSVILIKDAVVNVHRFIPFFMFNFELPLRKRWNIFAGGYTGVGIPTDGPGSGDVQEVSCLQAGVVIKMWKYLDVEIFESWRYTKVTGAEYTDGAARWGVPVSPFTVNSFTTCIGIRPKRYKQTATW